MRMVVLLQVSLAYLGNVKNLPILPMSQMRSLRNQCFATTTLYSLIVSFNTLKLSLNTLKLSSDTHSLFLSLERERESGPVRGRGGRAGRPAISLSLEREKERVSV